MHTIQDLEKYLAQFTGQTIVYCPNPGNAGDGIIANATYQLFDKLNIQYQYVPTEVDAQRTAGKVVVYGGGGNLVHPYPNARDFIARHHRGASRLVVLPHTIRSYPELFEEISGNVDLFCRDLPSYEFMSSVKTQANVYLSHDVALHTNVKLTIQYRSAHEQEYRDEVVFSRRAKRSLRSAFHSVRNAAHPKTLHVFREDVERTAVAIPFSNVDLSQTLCGLDMSPFHARETASAFFAFIQRHDVVKTNRLHVCIASLLLGKEVHFYDNSYGKNMSIYNFSLKGRFDKLTMHTEQAA